MQFAKPIFAALLVGSLAALSARAIAQDSPGPASAPAAPAIQVPQVQTPTITNQPTMPQLPSALQPGGQPRAQSAPAQADITLSNTLESNDFQEFIAQSLGTRLCWRSAA